MVGNMHDEETFDLTWRRATTCWATRSPKGFPTTRHQLWVEGEDPNRHAAALKEMKRGEKRDRGAECVIS